MGASDNIRDFFGLPPSRTALADQKMSEAKTVAREAQNYVQEGLMVMLSLALEDRGWILQDGFKREAASANLTFSAIQGAAKHGRALIAANPVIRSAALAKTGYVLSQPVRITGAKNIVEANKKSFFGLRASIELLLSKMADGNLLWICDPFLKTMTRVPFYEIKGAIYDPNDPSAIQYFYRVWTETITDWATQRDVEIEHKLLIPNMDYERGGVALPDSLLGIPVLQRGVMYHYAANRLVGAAWGVPDLLAGIFYAGEHKELIEAADAIYRAQSQYAIQYKGKNRKALEAVAAHMAAPAPIDPLTGESGQYGQSIAFGGDVEMQLMSKIGSGIDFGNFDAIAALASSVLGIPLDTVLGKEKAGEALPPTLLRVMRMEQLLWDEVLHDILTFFGKPNAKTFWPPIDPDATHRQVQSIVGAAKLRINSPEETRALLRDTFGADWADAVPNPKDWDAFLGPAVKTTVAPGSTEINSKPITPGQGQSGQIGKLADGDHELRDAGEQAHTQK